jgi:choline transport protein
MVEEVSNAGRAVPLAIVWSYVGNATVAFIVIVFTLWSIPDVEVVLSPDTNPYGFAFVWALQQAGPQWAQAITTVIVFIAFAGCTGCNAAASREMAAFARDGGLPGSAWLSRVSAVHPVNRLTLLPRMLTCLKCVDHEANSSTS